MDRRDVRTGLRREKRVCPGPWSLAAPRSRTIPRRFMVKFHLDFSDFAPGELVEPRRGHETAPLPKPPARGNRRRHAWRRPTPHLPATPGSEPCSGRRTRTLIFAPLSLGVWGGSRGRRCDPLTRDTRHPDRPPAQCDINTGRVMVSRMPRVVPPRTNSRKRECPYPPITIRSAWESNLLGCSPRPQML